MTGSSMVDLYSRIYIALVSLWDFFTMPFYDALIQYRSNIPLLGKLWGWFADLIGNVTGLADWLNQFNLITFMLGSGVVAIIIVWLVKFLGDAIGL